MYFSPYILHLLLLVVLSILHCIYLVLNAWSWAAHMNASVAVFRSLFLIHSHLAVKSHANWPYILFLSTLFLFYFHYTIFFHCINFLSLHNFQLWWSWPSSHVSTMAPQHFLFITLMWFLLLWYSPGNWSNCSHPFFWTSRDYWCLSKHQYAVPW